MKNEVLNLFNNQITESGLKELKAKYPADLVVDMTQESEFKNGRKTRTEKNKLTKAINDRRLDLTKELKAQGDSLIEQVEEIYSVIVEPFEAEDQKRKEEAARQKRELEELLDKERGRIQSIKGFFHQCHGKDSVFISEMIESVDLIETSDFHKEIIHEAIEAKKETLNLLTQMLADTKARETVEKERAKMAVQERINNLQMIPSTMFGKTVAELGAKITSIENYQVTEVEFFDRVGEVEQLKQTVLQQLNMMLQQAKQMEEMKAQQEKISAVESDALDGTPPLKTVKHEPEQQLDIEEVSEPKTTPHPLDQVGDFLKSGEDVLEDLAYLLMSNDARLEQEAVANLKRKFKERT